MFNTKFGIELEMTGITRRQASQVISDYMNLLPVEYPHRNWQVVRDGSIRCQRKVGGSIVSAGDDYSVEVVSPVLTYNGDINVLQELVRRLRKAGAFVNDTCGIHIHLDGSNHTVRSIRNFINIIAARNDLFYNALQIPGPRMRYCMKMDEYLVAELNKKKPRTMSALENIWYAGYGGPRETHYHQSRYHFLNLHCFFHGNHTVELRGFNSTLHAGKVRAYVMLAIALNNQALTQKYASPVKSQEENKKFAMRVYLNRIGFIGEDFKTCRQHLYEHLPGNAAWRYGSKEACRSHVKKKEKDNNETKS